MRLSSGIRNNGASFLIVIILCHIGLALWDKDCSAKTTKFDCRVKQISSYQNIDVAMQDVNLLKSKGFNAYYEKVMIPGKGIWYRVFIVKSQKPSRSRETLKNKKRIQERAKKATNSLYSSAGKSRSSTSKPDAGIPVQGVKASSGLSQTILKKSAIPDVNNNKSERLADRKTNNVSDQIKNKNATVQSGYELVKAEFDSGHYEKAVGMLSVIISRKQNDAALQENSLRCLADCYYFLGEGEDRNFNSKAVESYKIFCVIIRTHGTETISRISAWQTAWNESGIMKKLIQPMKMSSGNTRIPSMNRMRCTRWVKFFI